MEDDILLRFEKRFGWVFYVLEKAERHTFRAKKPFCTVFAGQITRKPSDLTYFWGKNIEKVCRALPGA